jgi:hypothetical protein
MAVLAWVFGVVVALTILIAVTVRWERRKEERQEERRRLQREPVTQEELTQEITEWVERKIREGFDSRMEIIELTAEAIEDDYAVDGVKPQVTEITDRLLAEAAEEAKSWPEVTDCDRIDAAFADLERDGIVARQNFACCINCGHGEIGAEIEAFSKEVKPIGYTFYHMQDTARAAEDGELWLAYGTRGCSGDDARVGQVICEALRKHGLTVEWNGDVDKRICVTGLEWKRRRPPEPPDGPRGVPRHGPTRHWNH